MKKNELIDFVIKQRNAGYTWAETAEHAFLENNICKSDGSPYSGAGFQSFVYRMTGKKHFGIVRVKKTRLGKVKNDSMMNTIETIMGLQVDDNVKISVIDALLNKNNRKKIEDFSEFQ